MGSNTHVNSLLLPEIGPDGLMREAPVIAYTEKIIENEQLQLKKYIDENYSKIRDIERELANLNLEMKLTAGPKKAALEHMRKKIEMSTESIRLAKMKEEQARKVWEEALNAVKNEEALKKKLCEDLNSLVQQSSNTQFARLEELKWRIENLNPSRSSNSVPYDVKPVGPAQISPIQDASSVPTTTATARTERITDQVNGGNAAVINGHNPHPSADSEGREKKKIHIHGRGKGIGAVPKGRGPGWTGAGFDVDGRN